MKNEPLISIIIPVYNQEKYIDACINSVLNQTYQNIHVIIVDDGSSDKSLEICKKYSCRDSRIKIITQENGGPSKARNTGIEAATGEYIGFVDSDDVIEPEMYERLLNNITKDEAELACIGMEYCYRDGSKRGYYGNGIRCVLEGEEILSTFLTNLLITFGPVDKLYSRKAIGEIRFDTSIRMCEDQKFVYDVLKNVKRVSYDPTICYHINCSENSLSRANASRYHLAMLDVNEYIFSELQKETDKEVCRLYNTDLCLTYFVPNYRNGQFMKEDIERVDSIIKENITLVLKKGDAKQKLKVILYMISPKLLKYILDKK